MKKNLLLLVILLLFNIVLNEDDCSASETSKAQICSSLGSGTNICHYDGKNCVNWYDDCSNYKPDAASFDDIICQSITPKIVNDNDKYKKCVVKTDNGKKTCEKEFKTCSELSSTECTASDLDLNLGTNKRCVLNNEKCELYYKDCTDSDLNTESKCEKNIPFNNAKKCIWNNEADPKCNYENRKCKDFISYSTKSVEDQSNYAICKLLSATSPKICFYDEIEKKCNEVYKQCENYDSQDTTISCANIKPLTEVTTGVYEIDSKNKCVLKNENCKTTPRVCIDHKKRVEDTDQLCQQLTQEKDQTKGNTMCSLENGVCKEIYITCSDYNGFVAENERKNDECESIIPRDSNKIEETNYKCSLEKEDNVDTCKRVKKECKDFKDEETCNKYVPADSKKCIFKNGNCIEEYKNCELYDQKVDSSQKKKTDCEGITPIYDGDVTVYKCVYSDSTGCKKKEILCEDYEGQNEDYCKTLKSSEVDKNCALINNKCVSQYSTCSSYKEKDKKICESIKLYSSEYSRCFLKNDKDCTMDTKLCSEYLGEDETECKKYRALDTTNNICTIENKKCIEKLKPVTYTYDYKYCSDYIGTDKNLCESIQPHDVDTESQIDYSSKCVYGDTGCERASRKCDEEKDETICPYIKTDDDTKKNCVFKNNKCVEQYKTCQLYQDNAQTINKEACESIILSNGEKCVYKEEGSGASLKKTCTKVSRSCSDFDSEVIKKSMCSGITLLDPTKKCTFSNNACSLVAKTCLELTSGVTSEEHCKNASTSSSYKECVLNSAKNGCEEKFKSQEVEVEVTEKNKEDKSKNENQNSFGGKKYFNKIIFIILCLLF